MRNRIATSMAAAAMAVVLGTGSAFAHYCTPINKQIGAGSVGTYDVIAGEFTPNKKLMPGFNPDEGKVNGGFVTFKMSSVTYDLFMHQMLPHGALSSGPDGDDHCDGRGVDSALDCLGIPHE